MGRRGSSRRQPSFLVIVIFSFSLVIFYLSWKSLLSPDVKIKNLNSVQRQSLFEETRKWKDEISERFHGKNNDQDLEHTLDINNKKGNVKVWKEHEPSINKEKIANKTLIIKPRIFKVKPNENQTIWNESEEFYHQPNSLISGTVTSMERLVHLDLKGAAPKMSYLELFIPLIVKLGATGLLIEYEDMFPYTGVLENISANNAYSMNNIMELLRLAKKYNLKVMPLIQTFGHMEFVLKSEFIQLRESDYTPQVIDITQNASYKLISEMIKQILNAHPSTTHLHIGCHEAYGLEKGTSAAEMRKKKISETKMFLKHVSRVASIVRGQADTQVTPVIWDDMFRKMPSNDIENSNMSSLVEIMVRQYSTNVPQFINKNVWNKYARVFKSVWIASAFKGATGAREAFTEPKHYLNNQLSWLDVIAVNRHRLKFKGVALTGSQRYDHFSTLCELLPVAIPSLAVCLATMMNAGFTKKIHMKTSQLITCHKPIELTFPKPNIDQSTPTVNPNCLFPGQELHYNVKLMYGHRLSSSISNNALDGWLSDYQVAHGFSSPNQLWALVRSLTKESSYYIMLAIPLRKYLNVIYSVDTVDEWMDENVFEQLRHIMKLKKKIKSLQQFKSWPKHPFLKVHGAIRNSSGFVGSNQENHNDLITRIENGMNVPYVSQTAQDKFHNANVPILPKHSFTLHNTLSAALENQQTQIYKNYVISESDQNKIGTTPVGSSDFEKFNENILIGEKFIDDNKEVPRLTRKENNTGGKYSTGEGSNDDTVSLLDQRKMEDIMDNKTNSSVYSKGNLNKSAEMISKKISADISDISEHTHLMDSQTRKLLDLERNSDNLQIEDGRKRRE